MLLISFGLEFLGVYEEKVMAGQEEHWEGKDTW